MSKKKQRNRINFIVLAALLSAIAVVLNFIQIPYIVPYLKIDLSEVMVLIALTFSLPLAITVAAIKALVMALNTTSGYIGEITLFIGSLTMIFSYSISRKKFSKIISLIIMTIMFAIIMTVLNYYIITPLYSGLSFNDMMDASGGKSEYLKIIVGLYFPFNLLKGSLVSIVFYFVSKMLHLGD